MNSRPRISDIMKYPLLLIGIIAIVAEVHCWASKKLLTIHEGLSNPITSKSFVEYESSPIILHKSCGTNFATVAIGTQNSSLIVRVYNEGLGINVAKKSQGHPMFGEYHASIVKKDVVAILLRSIIPCAEPKVPVRGDIWELFLFNMTTRSWKTIQIEEQNPDYVYQSMIFVPYNDGQMSPDAACKLQIHKTNKITNGNKLEVREYTSSLELLYAFEIKSQVGLLKSDRNSKIYYRLEHTSLEYSRFEVLQWLRWNTEYSFSFHHQGTIYTTPKALDTSYNHVSFCYGYDFNNTIIECQMFNIGTRKIFATHLIDVRFNVQEIYVKNLDENNSIVVWTEKPEGFPSQSSNTLQVWAKLLGSNNNFEKEIIMVTADRIEYIHYDISDASHCLKIGTIGSDKISTINGKCFCVRE